MIGLPATSKLARIAIGAGLALLLIAAFVWWVTATEKADDEANQTIGAQGAVITGQQTTLETIGKANDAAETVRRDPDAARAECLQNARNPDDC